MNKELIEKLEALVALSETATLIRNDLKEGDLDEVNDQIDSAMYEIELMLK